MFFSRAKKVGSILKTSLKPFFKNRKMKICFAIRYNNDSALIKQKLVPHPK